MAAGDGSDAKLISALSSPDSDAAAEDDSSGGSEALELSGGEAGEEGEVAGADRRVGAGLSAALMGAREASSMRGAGAASCEGETDWGRRWATRARSAAMESAPAVSRSGAVRWDGGGSSFAAVARRAVLLDEEAEVVDFEELVAAGAVSDAESDCDGFASGTGEAAGAGV